MEFKSFKSLLACFAILCSLNVSAQVTPTTIGNNVKFYLGVTGYDGNNTPSTVSTTVYDNYNFVVQLPDGDKAVATNKATFDIQMQNVATLGLSSGEIRKYFYTATTGVETGTKPILSEWLNNCYGFAGANCNITVIDKKGSKTFKYDISSTTDNNQIIGTAVSSADAREAWHKIASHVSTGQNTPEDSKVIIKEGTYVKMGGESWDFTNDVTVLSGNWQLSETVTAIKNASKVTPDTNAKNNVAIIYLPAGSTIALGGSYATLEDEATITFEMSEVLTTNFKNMLSDVRTATDQNKQEALASLVETFDKIIGIISESSSVKVTVDFGHPECFIDVYPGNKNVIEDQTIDQYLAIQESQPNAVGFIEYSVANIEAIKDLTNVVVKYPVGTNGNYYYECNKFILQDPTQTGAPFSRADFYSPCNFVAVSGEYNRNIGLNTATACLPFAIDYTDISSSTRLLTFSLYQVISTTEAYAYFNYRTHINAGVPFFIFDTDQSGIHYQFDNTEIVGTPDNSANLQGAFIRTDSYKNSTFYGVNNDGIHLGKVTGYISPFRSCLGLSWTDEFAGGANHQGGSAIKERTITIGLIDEDGETTSINGDIITQENSQTIYNLNGLKVREITKPGLYIINGIKTLIK